MKTTGPDDPFRFEAAKSLEDSLRELVAYWNDVYERSSNETDFASGVAVGYKVCAKQVEDLLK